MKRKKVSMKRKKVSMKRKKVSMKRKKVSMERKNLLIMESLSGSFVNSSPPTLLDHAVHHLDTFKIHFCHFVEKERRPPPAAHCCSSLTPNQSLEKRIISKVTTYAASRTIAK